MIRNGFIGDALKMMPMFENIDKEEIDLSPVPEYLDHEVDNVRVPTLPQSSTSPYIKNGKACSCKESDCPSCGSIDQKASGSAMGSAGNSLVKTDAEPQFGSIDGGDPSGDPSGEPDEGDGTEPMMDSLGIGAGMKPEMKLNEATESGAVIDDDSMKTAHKNSMANPMNMVDDLFNQFAFKPKKSPKFDSDTTKPMNTLSKEPIKRIPKGW